MTEPTLVRPVRTPSLYAGLFDGAYRPCAELPDAMRALLDTLAAREQASAEPVTATAQR